MKNLIVAFCLILSLCPSVFPQSGSLVFRGATVIDGGGGPSFVADVRVKGDRISSIGKLKPKKGETVIDTHGLVLAPGFIDIHNHSETGLVREGSAENQVSQGITSVLVGPDGGSPWPIGEYLAKLEGKIGPNVGAFVGHGEVRGQVMKEDFRRASTDAELASMIELVERAMREGAFGLSSGLEYEAGSAATTEELIALARIAARYKGIYMSHIRDEEEGFRAALEEALRVGREARLPVQISHLKMGNRNVWGRSSEAIALIESAKAAGQDVTGDAYPYTAWASTITVLVPRDKQGDIASIEKGLANVGGADKVVITSHAANRSYEMKTMLEIASAKSITPAELYIEIVKNGGAGVVCHSMNENDVKAFYQRPWVMVASDGGIGSRHPRGTGTFPRVLARFVREAKWMSLEEAVRKMSSMPASRLGLKDRGRIKKGMKADLVIIDPNAVIDNATFADPQKLSSGVKSVWVNGKQVWDGQKSTGLLPGSILRHKK